MAINEYRLCSKKNFEEFFWTVKMQVPIWKFCLSVSSGGGLVMCSIPNGSYHSRFFEGNIIRMVINAHYAAYVFRREYKLLFLIDIFFLQCRKVILLRHRKKINTTKGLHRLFFFGAKHYTHTHKKMHHTQTWPGNCPTKVTLSLPRFSIREATKKLSASGTDPPHWDFHMGNKSSWSSTYITNQIPSQLYYRSR